ncbi:unnamed protein product [Boreogadus saida]
MDESCTSELSTDRQWLYSIVRVRGGRKGERREEMREERGWRKGERREDREAEILGSLASRRGSGSPPRPRTAAAAAARRLLSFARLCSATLLVARHAAAALGDAGAAARCRVLVRATVAASLSRRPRRALLRSRDSLILGRSAGPARRPPGGCSP